MGGRLVPRVQAVESLAIRAALGRVLARDIVSPIHVPAHDNAAMDGYALRAADLASEGDTLLGVAGTQHFHRPWLLAVHGALSALMAWLLGVAWCAWTRR